MRFAADAHLDDLPGADLVRQGIDDLEHGHDTVAAALTRMAAPRLRSVRLYELLAASDAATAHSRYNALVGRMVSFARAAERARPG